MTKTVFKVVNRDSKAVLKTCKNVESARRVAKDANEAAKALVYVVFHSIAKG